MAQGAAPGNAVAVADETYGGAEADYRAHALGRGCLTTSVHYESPAGIC